MPQHSYIFRPTGEMWPAGSVNARIRPIANGDRIIAANVWLDRNWPVEQMTWAPGLPTDIKHRLVTAGGWIERAGCTVFNLYRPPSLRARPGDASKWVEHVKKLYGDDADHLINWLAHRVQFPAEKINHAIVLGGAQGIGKDTLLEPVKHAVGPWNFLEVSPVQLLGRFNGFLKSVILRISEARDLGEVNRFAFYDHTKSIIASPPDVLRVDEKNIREYSVFNVCGVILTTNHKTDGLYLPADDRRHFVAWSDVRPDDFEDGYWTSLYRWFADGGCEIVAHYLAEHDLTEFDPKAPPPKTEAFWEIADAGHAPENAELLTVLVALGKQAGQTDECGPDAITIRDIWNATTDHSLREWLDDRKYRKQIPHRLEDCGYVRVHNHNSKQGLWTIGSKKQAVYARTDLPLRDRIAAARRLT
jgi:hypothetical protein